MSALVCDGVAICSKTSPCMKITDPFVTAMDEEGQLAFVKAMTKLLEKDGIAYDIASHRDAPAGLRVWTGATVEASGIKLLTPWLDWAFEAAKADAQKKAA